MLYEIEENVYSSQKFIPYFLSYFQTYKQYKWVHYKHCVCVCVQTNKCHLGSSDKAVQTRYKMLFQDVTTI